MKRSGHDYLRADDNLSLSGRVLLLCDLIAMMLAFICGGWTAYLLNPGAGTIVFSPLGLREFMIFLGLGGLSILWLDARSHYRQRLPYWEHAGHIFTVCFAGLIVCGCIQFAFHSMHSRLWLTLNWLYLCLFLFIGRGLAHRW